MGAGRKKIRRFGDDDGCDCNLRRNELGGVIFGCTKHTIDECLSDLIFGLPERHYSYVKNIEPGLPLFLFNFSDRTLHGVFEAASHGRMYINSYGWTGNGSFLTKYPAQVHARIWKQCQPLSESEFRKILQKNYYDDIHFQFELDQWQTSQLISLFESSNLTISFNSPVWSPLCGASPISHSGHNQFSVSLQQVDSEILLQPPRDLVMFFESELQNAPTADSQVWKNICYNGLILDPFGERRMGLGELVFLMGGSDTVSQYSTVECYSPFTDKVRYLESMSTARSCASAVVLNDFIYNFGGWNGDLWYDTVECYNPFSNKWFACPPLSETKGCQAGASLYDKIFAIGGGNAIDCFKEVEMFDPAIGRWIPTRPMLEKRFACASADLGGVIYVVGGYDGKNHLKSGEQFDLREGSWSKLPIMNTCRESHALTAFKGKLYALGGYDGEKYVPSVEVFDPRMGSWSECAEMKQPRGYFFAQAIGEAIYVIGGHTDDNIIVDTVETYRQSQGWSVTELKGFGKRCFFSAVLY
ncbi:hypothetical protein ACHQM5_001979 [Ranunculus cassubicifolius]